MLTKKKLTAGGRGKPQPPDPAHPRRLSVDKRLDLLLTGVAEFNAGAAKFKAGAAELLKAVETDRKNNEGHRDNLARALEDEFVASLPRVMQEAHDIVIKPEDIIVRKKLRAPKGGAKGEIDFIAPNGKLVLVGEVGTHLTKEKVDAFFGTLDLDFRGWFPKYADRPIYGVVAGALIDPPAAVHARKRGFIILRLDGAGAHPATVRGARKHTLKKY